MTSAADLFGLQEIDLSRDQRRALIADIESRIGETEDLIAARELVQSREAEVEGLRRRQRDLDAAVEDLDAKIRPVEAKLYGGSIRNPKELTDLQKDVNSLKARRGKFDDQSLASMEATEAATRALDEAKVRLSEVEEAWRVDQRELLDAKSRAERDMAALDDERQRRTKSMDSPHLGVYESLRNVKQGRPVARIERGACQGCRLTLPTYVVQKARSAVGLVQCPSCERILVGG